MDLNPSGHTTRVLGGRGAVEASGEEEPEKERQIRIKQSFRQI